MDHQALIQDYLDGELTEQQFAELSDWLAQSEANREAFVRATTLDTHLYKELAQDDLSRFLNEVDIDALRDVMEQTQEDSTSAMLKITEAEVGGKDEVTLSRAVGVLSHAGAEIASRSLKRYAALLSLAAVLAIAVTLIIVFGLHGPKTGTPSPNVADLFPESDQPAKPQPVATLTATHHAQWAEPSTERALARGSRLNPGDRLTLTAGFAEITTHDGAVAILQAPASVELLDDNNALRLHTGKLVGICETESSKGFVVYTTNMLVTDLGTRFGVSIEADGSGSTGVIEGEVEVQEIARTPTDTPRKITLTTNQQVHTDTDGQLAEAITMIEPDHGYLTGWDAVQYRVDVQGQARFFDEPPADIGPDGLQDPGLVLFREKTAVLDQPINVWVDLKPTADTAVPGTIAAGTKVVSYMIHYRPGAAGGSAQATLTFPGKVLGLATKYKWLVATNRLFALDSVAYVDEADLNYNYFIDGQPGDAFEIIGEAQNILQIKLSAADHSDQARILVEVPADE